MVRNRKRTTSKANWCEQDLRHAVQDTEKGLSLRGAAKKYNIPFSTLQERLKKKNISDPTLGKKPVFTKDQERNIATQVKALSSIFYGLTMTDLRKLVYKYASINNIKNTFNKETQMAGVDWLNNFLRRNPSVAVRKAEATSLNRVVSFNKHEVTIFYNLLESLMEKHKFTPNNIYNADETGITTVTDPGKVLAEKGQRRVGAITSGERGRNITVMCAMSAAGNFIPPMFIFPRQRMTPLLQKDGPAGAMYTNSKNGWINEHVFVEWLKHFATYAKPSPESPVLLVIDNHASHISLAAYTYCKETNIIMLSIPPHSSHRIQPLDVVFYGPLKAAYRQECNLYMKSHLMAKITPYEVASLFNKAYSNVATINKGESGFRVTGIYPINPNVFSDQDFLAASMMSENANDIIAVEPSVEMEENTPLTTSFRLATDTEQLIAGPSHALITDLVPCTSSHTTNLDKEISESSQTQITFAQIAPMPTPSTSSTRSTSRKRQHATCLTATPMKDVLEDKEARKDKIKKKGGTTKLESKKKAKVLKNVGKVKRRVLQSSSSEEEDFENLCDDDSLDDLPTDTDKNKCIICKEFGRNNELWYRCTICGYWAHADCTGWDSAEGYICDLCIKCYDAKMTARCCLSKENVANEDGVGARSKGTFTYDEAVELTGNGRYNYLLLAACSVIAVACALDMFGYATVVAAASCDLNLDITQLGVLASAPFAGVLSAFPWGYYADTQGRKKALLITTAGGFVFSVISSFSTHWVFMLAIKIVGSLFSTASFTLMIALLGECTGEKHRNQYLFIMNSCNLSAELFLFALAWVILPLNFKLPLPLLNATFRPWRLYTISLALPLGISAVLLLFLYESPKYLASRGDCVKALEVMKSIYERNGGKKDDYPVKHIMQPSDSEMPNKKSFWKNLKQQTLPIFKPPLLWRTVQLFFLMAVCCTTNNVFVMMYPTMVNYFYKSFTIEDSSDQTFCQRVFGESNVTDTQTFKCNDEISKNTLYSGMLYGLFFGAMGLAFIKVASRPRLLLILILLVSAASELLVNVKQPIANMIFFTLLQATSLGIGCVSTYFVDLYPTMCRGQVTGLGMMVGRLCSFLGVSLIGTVITQHCEATFYSWSVFVFGAALVCLLLPPDRKAVPVT